LTKKKKKTKKTQKTHTHKNHLHHTQKTFWNFKPELAGHWSGWGWQESAYAR